MATIRKEVGLSFDDVLIVPHRSDIKSRSLVSTRSTLAGDIELSIPLISSNMDTVTMSKMAIAMARVGGIGFLHRYLTIEEECHEIEKVKRYRSHIIYDPYSIDPNSTVERSKELVGEHGVGGLMVVGERGELVGILTLRDIYGESGDTKVADAMTPLDKMILGDKTTTPDQARALMHKGRVEKLPLLDEQGKPFGLIVMKDIRKLEDYPKSSLDAKGRLMVGGSVGVVGDFLDRARELERVGADCLVVDVAHAHAKHVIDGVKALKKTSNLPVIAGTVATREGCLDLIKAGADSIRVGVGPGSACSTRTVAGAGVPQLSALLECAEVAKGAKIPIIADGGIKGPADLSKAIAAGSQAAMLGSLFAGTAESPGRVVVRDGQRYKIYRGMASMGAFVSKQMAEGGSDQAAADYTPEGVEHVVPYKESVEGVIKELVGGLRSGMSYTGTASIEEFHERVEFVRLTEAGQRESRPHILERHP